MGPDQILDHAFVFHESNVLIFVSNSLQDRFVMDSEKSTPRLDALTHASVWSLRRFKTIAGAASANSFAIKGKVHGVIMYRQDVFGKDFKGLQQFLLAVKY